MPDISQVPKRRRVWTATVADEAEPIEFELQFTKSNGDTKDEVFQTLGQMWAGADFTLGSTVRFTQDGRRVADVSAIITFFDRVLIDADNKDRFRTLINDPEWMVETELIADVFQWVVEEMAGRPTSRSTSSSNGRPPTSDSSTAPQLEAAPISGPSPSPAT